MTRHRPMQMVGPIERGAMAAWAKRRLATHPPSDSRTSLAGAPSTAGSSWATTGRIDFTPGPYTRAVWPGAARDRIQPSTTPFVPWTRASVTSCGRTAGCSGRTRGESDGEEKAGEEVGLLAPIKGCWGVPGRGEEGTSRGEGAGTDRQGTEAEARQAAARGRP